MLAVPNHFPALCPPGRNKVCPGSGQPLGREGGLNKLLEREHVMIQRRLFHVQKKVRLRFSLFFLVFSFSVESSKKMVFCIFGNPCVHLVRLHVGDLLLKCLLGLVSISQNRWPSNKTQILVLFQDLQACLNCEQKLQCCCCTYKMHRPCTM